MIPYGRQDIDEADMEAVLDVLRSDFLTTGPKVVEFESVMGTRVAAAHAVAVNSATSALHIACLALDLGPGDCLWTVPNTFVASANCARYCGATVDFVDIDPATWCMSVEALTAKLEAADRAGTLPKIVVPVHFSGQSCDMRAIGELAGRYGFSVIEDASHAVGARYRNQAVGQCAWSAITVFSFHPVKIMTTGEGGMAMTQDAALAERMRMYRSHGITRDPEKMETACQEPWYYEQLDLGLNYRITDIQAALGISQLLRLDAFLDARNDLAQRYGAALSELPLTLPHVEPACYSSWHLYVVHVPEKPGRDVLFRTLRSEEIGANVHYIPVHLQPYYRRLGYREGMFPVAEAHGRDALTLPLYPKMTGADFHRVISAVKRGLA